MHKFRKDLLSIHWNLLEKEDGEKCERWERIATQINVKYTCSKSLKSRTWRKGFKKCEISVNCFKIVQLLCKLSFLQGNFQISLWILNLSWKMEHEVDSKEYHQLCAQPKEQDTGSFPSPNKLELFSEKYISGWSLRERSYLFHNFIFWRNNSVFRQYYFTNSLSQCLFKLNIIICLFLERRML